MGGAPSGSLVFPLRARILAGVPILPVCIYQAHIQTPLGVGAYFSGKHRSLRMFMLSLIDPGQDTHLPEALKDGLCAELRDGAVPANTRCGDAGVTLGVW